MAKKEKEEKVAKTETTDSHNIAKPELKDPYAPGTETKVEDSHAA